MKLHTAFLILIALVGCRGESPKTELRQLDLPPPAREENPLRQSLRETADRLLRAIHDADAETFLALCSRDSINVGVDNEVEYADLKKAMEARDFYYCHYFDTACLQEKLKEVGYKAAEDLYGQKPLPVSYRELLNRVTELEVTYEIRQPQAARILGLAIIKWKTPRPRDLGLLDFVQFTFQYEDDRWNLISDDFVW
jgi:hypothetical protein